MRKCEACGHHWTYHRYLYGGETREKPCPCRYVLGPDDLCACIEREPTPARIEREFAEYMGTD